MIKREVSFIRSISGRLNNEGVNIVKRKRVLSLFLLITLFVLWIPSTVFAALEDVDPYQMLFNENLGRGFKDGQPLFMKYSLINYRLDYAHGDQVTSGAGGTFLLINTILSFCMVGMALAAKLTIDIMTWAFSYNQIDLLTENIESIVDKLVDELFFSELFAVGLFVLGVSLFFTFSKREDVAGKLLKVIFNLVIAFTLLANMGTIIRALNQISQWGSDAVFIAFESVVGNDVKEYDNNKGRNAFFNVSEKFFEYNVHIPWQLSEFGLYVPSSKTTLTAEERELKEKSDQILREEVRAGSSQDQQNPGGALSALDPAKFTNRFSTGTTSTGTLDGQTQTQNNASTSISMSSFGIPFRIFVVWLTFTVGTLYGCLLLAIAGTAIICQFLMYLLAIVSPLVFLIVLVPEWGDQMLIKWLQGMITSAVYKILASFLLVMILVVQSKIYDVSQGWAYAMFAQVVLVFTVFLFRRNIMEYIPLPGMAAFQYTENTLFDKGKSIVDKTFGTVVDRAKVTVVGAAPTGLATGNPAMFSTQRAAVNTIEQQENKQMNRKGIFESLGEMVQSKTSNSVSEKEGSAKEERRQTSLRRRANLEETVSTSETQQESLRKTATRSDGYVRVGDVKEAIDRLANQAQPKPVNPQIVGNHHIKQESQIKNINLSQLREELEQGKEATQRPVDVRVVEMKGLPHMLDKFADTSVDKQKRIDSESSIDKERIETSKRTVTSVVKEEKVEKQVQESRRTIPKLNFPEIEQEEKQQDQQAEQEQQNEDENKELDSEQMEHQSADTEFEREYKDPPTVGKDDATKKKDGWFNKMIDKMKK